MVRRLIELAELYLGTDGTPCIMLAVPAGAAERTRLDARSKAPDDVVADILAAPDVPVS